MLQIPGGNSWLYNLISTIIGNLKVTISNVHIRYEDSVRFAKSVTIVLVFVVLDVFFFFLLIVYVFLPSAILGIHLLLVSLYQNLQLLQLMRMVMRRLMQV